MIKIITLGIMLLFIGMTISSTGFNLEKQSTGDVITVDDEGDGDYQKIGDAVNYSKPGDTIEVYSGNYIEDDIRIEQDGLTLVGLPYELALGNDTGKPIIIRKGREEIFMIVESGITVDGFIMEDKPEQQGYHSPFIGLHTNSDCVIINNEIWFGGRYCRGIYGHQTQNSLIKNNIISTKNEGIYFEQCNENIVTGNVIADSEDGIILDSSDENSITGNTIINCDAGIDVRGSSDNEITLNHLENNSIGIVLDSSYKTKVTQCNFVDNSKDVRFWFIKIILLQRWVTLTRMFKENYWDGWDGTGPMMLFGQLIYFIGILPIVIPPFPFIPIILPLPWILFDWYPASEPYDIGV